MCIRDRQKIHSIRQTFHPVTDKACGHPGRKTFLFDLLSLHILSLIHIYNMEIKAVAMGLNDKEKITSLLQLVGLDPKERKHVGKYSLGMKQRLGIAVALLGNPDRCV